MFEQTWQVSGCCGRREEPASQGHHKTICEESVSNQECQLSFVVVVMTCVISFTVVLMLSFAVCVACAAIAPADLLMKPPHSRVSLFSGAWS